MFTVLKARLYGSLSNPQLVTRILSVWLFLLFLFANAAPALAGDPAPQKGGLGEALAGLTKMLVDGLIAVSALLLAVGIATGFVTGMLETMVGRPGGLSSTWLRIAGVVVCFVGAVFTIVIANTIIDTLGQYKSTDSIHTP